MKLINKNTVDTGIVYFNHEPKLAWMSKQEKVVNSKGEKKEVMKFNSQIHLYNMDGRKIISYKEYGARNKSGEFFDTLSEVNVKCYRTFFVLKKLSMKSQQQMKYSYSAYTYNGTHICTRNRVWEENERFVVLKALRDLDGQFDREQE